MAPDLPFNDLHPTGSLAAELEEAFRRVLASGWYLLGPELARFEASFAAYVGQPHAVGVANGTDAIELALRAGGIGPGDEVLTVSHTAVATVCAVERTGATPVLVDIDPETYTMDPAAAEAALTARTRALVPVHLYGHPADVPALRRLSEQHGLLLIEDCAQAHGARIEGRSVGTFGRAAAFSFYPTKNLGALGDAGAVTTHDRAFADRVRRLRYYGQETRYRSVERGMNSRLDELQAAFLDVKLRHLPSQTEERRRLAAAYRSALDGLPLGLPHERPGCRHVYHLFVVRHPRRDALADALARQGIGTLVHYPEPVHLQPGYRDVVRLPAPLTVTERVAREVLSLPLYVGLSDDQVARVSGAMRGALQALGEVA